MAIRWFPSIYLGKLWDSILKQSMTTSKHNNLIILRYLPYYQEEIFQTSTQYCICLERGRKTGTKLRPQTQMKLLTLLSHVQDKILDCHTNTNPTKGIPALMLWWDLSS
jgi:hypothetical protein